MSHGLNDANLKSGGVYDVYLAGSVGDSASDAVVRVPENDDEGLIMEKRFQNQNQTGVGRRASTADIIGRNGAVDPKFRKYYDQLLEMRESLMERRGRLGNLESVEEVNHNVNLADRGTDEYDEGARFGQFSNDQEAVFEIDQALRRIADGTYGICEATGEKIPADRLEVIPWARFAKDVEEGVEREEEARKPRHII